MLCLIAIIAGTQNLTAADWNTVIGIGYFIPSGQDYKEIYGEGIPVSVQAGISFWKIQCRTEIGILRQSGALTFSQETTHLEIWYAGLGIYYFLFDKKWSPYGGLGIGLDSFTESNSIGTVRQTVFDLSWRIGLVVPVHPSIAADIQCRMNRARVAHEQMEAEIGGIALFIGFTCLL